MASVQLWPPPSKTRTRKARKRSGAFLAPAAEAAIADANRDESEDEEEEEGDELQGMDDEPLADEEEILFEDEALHELLDRAESLDDTRFLQSESGGTRRACGGNGGPASTVSDVACDLAATLAPSLDAPEGLVVAQDVGGQGAASCAHADAEPSPARARRGTTDKATASLEVEGGRISFYSKKNCFEAVCCSKSHGKCVLTRTSNGRKIKGKAGLAGGRPVAFLALWLGRHTCASKAEHMSKDASMFSFEQRYACRQLLQESVAGSELLSHERPHEPDEGSEPEDLVGLWT
eukprot:5756959-Amphidinium_carterae.8